MRTITITPKARATFLRTAQHAVDVAKQNRCLVRFTFGPAEHRQTFTAAPKKSVYTLSWEWAKSTAGQIAARAEKRAPRTRVGSKLNIKTMLAVAAVIGAP